MVTADGDLGESVGNADVGRRQMSFAGVRVEESSGIPVFILRETGHPAYLPIWCGATEAVSLTHAHQRVRCGSRSDDEYDFPYDVLSDALGQAGVQVLSTSILSLENGIFYSEIELSNGARVDARPSDSVALALWVGAPIFATASVMAQVGVTVDERSGGGNAELGAAPDPGAAAMPPASVPPGLDPSAMSPMELVGVQVEQATNNVFIELRAEGPGTHLYLRTSAREGAVIMQTQRGIASARPLAHDFFCNILTAAEIRLRELSITSSANGAPACKLMFSAGDSVQIRPGDGVAIALRASAPMLASAQVLNQGSNAESREPASQTPSGPGPAAEREELLALVQRRLSRFSDSQDPSLILDPEAWAEVTRLVAAWGGLNEADRRVWHAVGWISWLRYSELPAGQKDDNQLQLAVQLFAGCLANRVDNIPDQLKPAVAEMTVPTAVSLLDQAATSTDPALLSATVDLWGRIVDAIPGDNADRTDYLSALARAHAARFRVTRDRMDLDAAVGAGRRAVDSCPLDHPNRAGHLYNLGITLGDVFGATGAPADLDTLIETRRDSVAAARLDDPGRVSYLHNLGVALKKRYDLGNSADDLDEWVEVTKNAARACPAGDPEKPSQLTNSALALLGRYIRHGRPDDVSEAIDVARHAAAASDTGEDAAHADACLGMALLARFRRGGERADLDDALDVARQLPRTAGSRDAECAVLLAQVANAMWNEFEKGGGWDDLDAAIDCADAADSFMPAGHQLRPGVLSEQAISRAVRGSHTGNPDDLTAAVGLATKALDLSGSSEMALRMANLSSVLLARYMISGGWRDLDEAISVARQAVDGVADDDPSRVNALGTLATALGKRFDRTGDLADLDQAVQSAEAAIAASPEGSDDWVRNTGNGASWRMTRSLRTGDAADLDIAIENAGAAARAAPAGPLRALFLTVVAAALAVRLKRSGRQSDADAAVAAAREAVALTPAGDAALASRLYNLANALCDQSDGTSRDGETEALNAYIRACNSASAPPSIRILAARKAAALLPQPDEAGEAAALLESAVRLLPELLARPLDRADKQHAISEFAGLASEAAACVLDDDAPGRPGPARALAVLEAGRAVLMNQALDTRSDLTDLRAANPDLAERFARLSRLLDEAYRPAWQGHVTPSTSRGPDRHHVAAEMEETLAEIRMLEGFASFCLPPSADELRAEAVDGPIVVFNVSARRSDAIVLTASDIRSISLPALTPAAVVERIAPFHRILGTGAQTRPSVTSPQSELSRILAWLWDNAVGPVLHALGYDRVPQPGETVPRIWWAPGGVLGLLPIHAAGHHDDPDGPAKRTVIDRVASSYTPTIRALRYARQARSRAAQARQRTLIVAMPTTPGLTSRAALPNVTREAEMLTGCLPDPILLTEVDPDQIGDQDIEPSRRPTKSNVLTQLQDCTIAHFACHGSADLADPSRSRLLLSDHASDPLTVASLAPVNLGGRTQLAYLSACSTAFAAAAQVVDEAIHMSSAFQLVGFPCVVSTLWEINDRLAVDMAEDFYRRIMPGGAVEPDRTAYALRDAVRAMRDRFPNSPSLWASYINSGA